MILFAAVAFAFTVAFFGAIGLGLILWSGWVAATLWSWFLVPIGVPALTVLQAAGICVILRFLTFNVNLSDLALAVKQSKEEATKQMWMTTGMLIVVPALTLFSGWIIHLLMML